MTELQLEVYLDLYQLINANPVTKPDMWPRKVEEVYYGGEGPHWTVVQIKKKKKKKKKNIC